MSVVRKSQASRKPKTEITASGWSVHSEDRDPFQTFASAADYVAKVEEAAKREPVELENAYTGDQLLFFGVTYYGLWRRERWYREYSFTRCLEIAVAAQARVRRTYSDTVSRAEAHLFELFSHHRNQARDHGDGIAASRLGSAA